MRSAKPSPFTSPALATDSPKPLEGPSGPTNVVEGIVLGPVALPAYRYARPVELLTSGALTTISAYPSPLRSPAPATPTPKYTFLPSGVLSVQLGISVRPAALPR